MMDNCRILIIDDHPEIHKDFRSIFQRSSDEQKSQLNRLYEKIANKTGVAPKARLPVKSYEVDSAYQGEEARTMVTEALRKNRPYAMAFVDVRMPPGLDGIQTIKQLWEIDPDLQIVICTAYSDRSWEEIFALLAPKDSLLILKKPFDVAEVLQIAHTLTEKWATSRQLRETNAKLAAANNALEKLVDSQRLKMIESYKLAHLGEMASGIAHELNTPISIIKLRSQQMSRQLGSTPPDIEKMDQFVKAIDTTCDRMSKIIMGLLTFAREPRVDEKSDHKIYELLESALILCTERFKYHDIKIDVQIPRDLTIHCNPTLMSQVFLNLLSNSFDAISCLDNKWIDIKGHSNDDGEIVIELMDSGKRIPNDLADKIMHPFFTTKPIGKGTGLGLSISVDIIMQHGGVLELDRERENMCFVIKLPG